MSDDLQSEAHALLRSSQLPLAAQPLVARIVLLERLVAELQQKIESLLPRALE